MIARSTAEAEFIFVAHGICEALRIKRFLADLKISCFLPVQVYCDNKVAIAIDKIQCFMIGLSMLWWINIL